MSEDLARLAAEAARIGSRALLRRFRDRTVEIQHKSENDLVSDADRESEEAIIGFLQDRLPDHQILSEEVGVVGPGGADYEWLVDPLDGTSNFLQGLPVWGISIACRRGDRLLAGVILEPVGDNLFVAWRGGGSTWNGESIRVSEQPSLRGAFLATGFPFRARAAIDAYLAIFKSVYLQARSIRRLGAASLDLAYTAAGIYDGFFEFRLSAWDLAAGMLIIEEAGGVVSDLDGGGTSLTSGNLVAGGPAVHEELMARVREHADESLLDQRVPQGV